MSPRSLCVGLCSQTLEFRRTRSVSLAVLHDFWEKKTVLPFHSSAFKDVVRTQHIMSGRLTASQRCANTRWTLWCGRNVVLASSPIVLCVCHFCLSFSELIIPDGVQRPNARCQCGAQWLLDIYTVSSASGRLTVQKASGNHRAPSILWKAPAAPLSAESHCATVRCSHPILAPRT